jgi:membrane-associated phospholipid phosphatase
MLPSPRAGRWATIGWLLLLTVACALAFLALYRTSVLSLRGQQADESALRGADIGRSHLADGVLAVLDVVSVAGLLGATLTIGFIALARRRVAVAVAASLLVVGANVSAQLLKKVLERPDVGLDSIAPATLNSFPSGHTTAAASVAVALVLVVPAAVRGLTALLGAAYAALTGVATLSAGWHRPSDAVASFLLVGVWAGLAGIAVMASERPAPAEPAESHPRSTAALAGVAAALLVVGALALPAALGTTPRGATHSRLFAAYVGGGAAIAGAALAVMAAVLMVAHHVVPRRATMLSVES